ncbi:MAG: amino acid adenylation domain-containing protein, partial [Pyrinomonadaceae bacterium]
WSMGVLVRELTALYEAYLEGRESPLAELSIQYADYAVWQREGLQGEVLAGHLSYWRERLEGVAVLELPTDHPRPAVQRYRGSRQTSVIERSVSAGLHELARREGATLFMVLLAGWQALLSRYSGQEDIAVGTPIAGRGRRELEGLIGFFVNTLVMRAHVDGAESFRELVRQVREASLGAYAHQELPFEKLVEELQPDRSLAHTPLFQVMFALQNAPRESLKLSGLTLSRVKLETSTSKFDLMLAASHEEDGIHLSLEYNEDLFDEATIIRMLDHFGTLLEVIVENPDERLSALRLLGLEERRRLLVEWNDSAREYPTEKFAHRLFEEQVERTPDAVAAIAGGESIKYGELNRRANRLARYLRARGVGIDMPVGILMERSIEMLVGVLGIMKAGAAYVPFDPLHPRERLAFMVADTGMCVLLTQRELASMADGYVERNVCIDSEWEAIEQESDANFDNDIVAENVAFVIYTSGSTGRPKGVQVTHGSMNNFLHAFIVEPGLTERDVLLAVTSLSFDIAVFELFVTLVTGARVVIASREMAASPKQLIDALNEYGVTAMQATPVTWRLLVEAGWQSVRPVKKLSGGEALQPKLAEALLKDGGPLWNGYGPSETSIYSTIHRVEARDTEETSVPIGRPVANTQVFILDDQLQPVPAGVPGEMYIGGDGVARGYANRPELTAERFIPDSLTGRTGARLYRTGDLARYLPDGRIEFRGRADHQVKLRGYRIELGEIEAVLANHPGVAACAVVVRESHSGEAHLIAYLVAGEDEPAKSELRSFMGQKLPEYMIPAAFVTLDKLPLTTSGKIDRKALPALDGNVVEDEYVAPRNPLEEKLAGVWAEVLKVARVGVNDNFFGLGGHSLLATQAISRVREVFKVELPLRSLFENPTVAGLSAAIARQQDGGQETSSTVIRKVSQEDDDLDELLAELDQLSDEEAQLLLVDETPLVARRLGIEHE